LGVRICRLVLVAAAIGLVGYAVHAGAPYFIVLAAGCVAAIRIQVRNVRTILSGIAFVECAYFNADMFSPAGGWWARDILFAVSGVLVAVAILRLRFWESATGTDLHPHLRLAAGTAGLILIISAAFMAFAPVSSSQLSGSTTNTECGSVLINRHLTNSWPTINIAALDEQCGQARHERLAFAFLQLEIGVGAIWAGRSALARQPKRALVLAGVIALISGGVGEGWGYASVSNANAHDEAFAPWFQPNVASFAELSAANNDLRSAVDNGNVAGAASACTHMQVIDDDLAPSVATWPQSDSAERATWKAFLTQHRADASGCAKSVEAAGSAEDLKSSEWFTDSASTIDKLHRTLSYW